MSPEIVRYVFWMFAIGFGFLSLFFFLISLVFALRLWSYVKKCVSVKFVAPLFWPDTSLDEKGATLKYYSRRFFFLFVFTFIGAVIAPIYGEKIAKEYDQKHEVMIGK